VHNLVHDGPGPGAGYATLFICSLSIPGYRLRDDPPYPGIVRDYQTSVGRLQGLPCDVFLMPRGSQFGLPEKAERARGTTGRSPFIDPEGCRAYLDEAARDLGDELSRAQSGGLLEMPIH
jgi:metallo-beta-lactamase class B